MTGRTSLVRLRSRFVRRGAAGLPPDVFTMAGVAFCVALGFGVVAPAIPLFAKTFGVGAGAAGAVVSAFALVRLLSGLVAGRLVDAIGVRPALAIGIAVVAGSSLLAGVAQSYPQLVVLRGIGGLGSAVFGVAAISVVLRVSTRQTRGQAMSIYRSGFLIGGIVGPALGGAVLGISLRAPFFLYAGTLGLAGTVALLFLDRRAAADPQDDEAQDDRGVREVPGAVAPTDSEASGSATVGDEPDPTLRTVLRLPEYQAALTSNLAVGLAVFGLRSAIVPLLFVDGLGAAPQWVGVAFLVSALVQTALTFPAGRWADRAGRKPALLAGAATSAVGLLLLGAAGTVTLALVGIAVFGAGSAFLGTVPGALVGDVVGRRSGTVVAVFNMASDLGAVVGPVLAGWLVDQGSYGAAFGMGAGVVVLAGLLGIRLPGKVRP